MEMQPVLAATDFSPLADAAIERAALLAKQQGSELHLLHVLPRITWEAFGRALVEHPLITEKQLYDAARARLEEVAQAIMKRHSISVRAYVDIGRPHEGIAEYVRAHAIGLTVLGPHAGSLGRDLFIGSTALRVLRASTEPTLVAQNSAARPYQRVLVAVDFSDISRHALACAARIAPHAEIHALHVFDVPFEGKMHYAGVDDDVIQQYRNAAAMEAEDLMNQFLLRLGKQYAVVPNTRQGHPARNILDEAHRIDADLIVIGKHTRSGLEQFIIGSVAEGVLYGLDRDLLMAIEHKV